MKYFSSNSDEFKMSFFKLHTKSMDRTLSESDMDHVLRFIRRDKSNITMEGSETDLDVKVPLKVFEFDEYDDEKERKAEIVNLSLFTCTIFRALTSYTNWNILEPKIPDEILASRPQLKSINPMVTLPASAKNMEDRFVVSTTTREGLDSILHHAKSSKDSVNILKVSGFELVRRTLQLRLDEKTYNSKISDEDDQMKVNIKGFSFNPNPDRFTVLASPHHLALFSFWSNVITTELIIPEVWKSVKKYFEERNSSNYQVDSRFLSNASLLFERYELFWVLQPPTKDFNVIQTPDSYLLAFTAPDLALRYYLDISAANPKMKVLKINVVSNISIRHQFNTKNVSLKGIWYNPPSSMDSQVVDDALGKFSKEEILECYDLINENEVFSSQ